MHHSAHNDEIPQHNLSPARINTPPSKQRYPLHRIGLMVWSMAAFFYLYEYILRVSLSVMTTPLMQDFGMTSASLGFLASLYYYGYTPLQIPCGVIVDRFGVRRVVTASAALCTLGCVLFGYAEHLLMAQAGRMLLGIGSACAYISTAKIAADWFHPKRFALFTSITMGLGLVGATFGGKPFAMLVNAQGWRESMILMACVGCAIIVLSWLIIRDRKDTQTPTSKPHEPVEKESLFAGLKIIASNPQCWKIGTYGCFMLLPLSAFAELWGVPYLMQVYGIDNEKASLATVMVFIGMAIGCPIAAWVSDILKSRLVIMRLSALLTTALFCFLVYGPTLPYAVTVGLLFMIGCVTSGQILYFAAVKELNPTRLSATAVGFTNALVVTSAIIFQPLLGIILDWAWSGLLALDGTPLYDLHAYKMALLPVPLCLLSAWFLLRRVNETYPSEAEDLV